jgi:hypothetical protein
VTTIKEHPMKKPRTQATDSLPAVLGKDEMNLAEYPFALLTSRSPSHRKTFTLTQQILDAYGKVITQTWAVLGSDRYGLPTPYDDDVMLALLYCHKETAKFRGEPLKRTVGHRTLWS